MHVHHLSRIFFSIFTSVVVYSRTTNSSHQNKKSNVSCGSLIRFWWLDIQFNNHEDLLTLHNKLNKIAKRKKNAEHTRMYTIFRNFLFTIFTSVVVYSRTTKEKHQKKPLRDVSQSSLKCDVFRCRNNYTPNLIKRAKRKKKCGAHTHVHHLFATLSSQYSRRLLSILAQL